MNKQLVIMPSGRSGEFYGIKTLLFRTDYGFHGPFCAVEITTTSDHIQVFCFDDFAEGEEVAWKILQLLDSLWTETNDSKS